MNYDRFDIKAIAEELDGHFNKYDMDSYTGQCSQCGNFVSQSEDCCAECKRPVVWFNSKIWRDLYGNPTSAARELSGELPTTATGLLLLKRAGVRFFPSVAEERQWARDENTLGYVTMEDVIKYVVDTKKRRGRAAVNHALNLANSKYKQYKAEQKDLEVTPAEETPTTEMW